MPDIPGHPGVCIAESTSGVPTITGVATSVTAFVGHTCRGVPDRATHITSFGDFEREYGGLDRGSAVSYAVRQFFANGGTQAIIVRVSADCTAATWTLQSVVSTAVLDVTATSPGGWGNGLRLGINRIGVPNPDSQFNLVVSQLQPDGLTLAECETHQGLDLNPGSARYVETVVNGASELITLRRRAGLVFDRAGFALSRPIGFPLKVAKPVIAGSIDGTLAFRLELVGPIPSTMPGLVAAVEKAIVDAGAGARLKVSESAADGSAGNDCLKLESGTVGEASCVTIAGAAADELARGIALGLANGGREFTGSAQHLPDSAAAVTATGSGKNGTRASAARVVGSPVDRTGIHALLDVDLFNILSIPETYDMTAAQATSVVSAAVELCEKRRAFYIADAPSCLDQAGITYWADSVDADSPFGNPPTYNAALYFPALRLTDPLDGMRPRTVAPSGTLAGVYARTDATRGVWKAAAGAGATLDGVAELAEHLGDAESGQLNLQGINPLRNFPAYGNVAWGARTLGGAGARIGAYRYIPVRRLALFLEESLVSGTQWVSFEVNGEPLWVQLRQQINTFMMDLFRQGAFQGSSARDAYFIRCGSETTTQADIALGVLNIIVGFAPIKPAEFELIQIRQMLDQTRNPA